MLSLPDSGISKSAPMVRVPVASKISSRDRFANESLSPRSEPGVPSATPEADQRPFGPSTERLNLRGAGDFVESEIDAIEDQRLTRGLVVDDDLAARDADAIDRRGRTFRIGQRVDDEPDRCRDLLDEQGARRLYGGRCRRIGAPASAAVNCRPPQAPRQAAESAPPLPWSWTKPAGRANRRAATPNALRRRRFRAALASHVRK